MAQPEYVPVVARDRVRVTERLPTPEGWVADRVAEVRGHGGQPTGGRFGVAGPDQGYALKLAHRLRPRLVLAPGEDPDDVVAGCLGVALRRASRYGRAPVSADLEVAFAAWGYLGAAPPELVEFRRAFFTQAGHHYEAQRAIAEQVPAAVLEMTPKDVKAQVERGEWRGLLGG